MLCIEHMSNPDWGHGGLLEKVASAEAYGEMGLAKQRKMGEGLEDGDGKRCRGEVPDETEFTEDRR